MTGPMVGFICLAIAIYGWLLFEIARFREEVQVVEAQDKEITDILDRAELLRAVRADLASPFALDHDNRVEDYPRDAA